MDIESRDSTNKDIFFLILHLLKEKLRGIVWKIKSVALFECILS